MMSGPEVDSSLGGFLLCLFKKYIEVTLELENEALPLLIRMNDSLSSEKLIRRLFKYSFGHLQSESFLSKIFWRKKTIFEGDLKLVVSCRPTPEQQKQQRTDLVSLLQELKSKRSSQKEQHLLDNLISEMKSLKPTHALQDELNETHALFQKISGENSIELVPLLGQINVAVHALEQIAKWELKNSRPDEWIIFDFEPSIRDPLEPSEHAAKTVRWQNGGVYLAYDTLGKSLAYCVYDNDIAAVKEGLVRPQIDAGFQLFIMIRETDRNESADELANEWVRSWLEKNQLLKLFPDWQNPIHRPGFIQIGRLEKNYTPAELQEMVRHLHKVRDLRLLRKLK